MKYDFLLEEYDDIMDMLHEREDIYNRGIGQRKIADREGSELYANGLRVVIPALDISLREGTEYYMTKRGEEEPIDAVILYSADETDMEKFSKSYCNTTLPVIAALIASAKNHSQNLLCYIDDSELIYDYTPPSTTVDGSGAV